MTDSHTYVVRLMSIPTNDDWELIETHVKQLEGITSIAWYYWKPGILPQFKIQGSRPPREMVPQIEWIVFTYTPNLYVPPEYKEGE